MLFGINEVRPSPIVSKTTLNMLICDTENLKLSAKAGYPIPSHQNVRDSFGRDCQAEFETNIAFHSYFFRKFLKKY